MLEGVSAAVTGVADLNLDWSSLSDEQFEQLCYDIIDAHPSYDSETIHKMGHSRSPDGGRDFVVHETLRWPVGQPRKWVFQCKLVTNGTSLGRTGMLDVGDMLEQYGAQGLGVMTSGRISPGLDDKLDSICAQRGVKLKLWSVYEISRVVARNPSLRRRYFEKS